MMLCLILSLIFYLLEQWCFCPVFPLCKHTVAISPVLVMSSGFAPLLINDFACSWHRLVVFFLVTLIFAKVQTLLKEYHNRGELSRKECYQKWIPRAILTETEWTNISRISAHVFVPLGLSKTPKFTLLAWWIRTTRRPVFLVSYWCCGCLYNK